MPLANQNFVAGGNINPSRFVSPAAAAAAWLTSTAYLVGQQVTQGGLTYICLVAHTSGTFATDLAASDWQLTPTNTAVDRDGSMTVIQSAGATVRILGVSMEGTDYPPLTDPRVTVGGYAAIPGEELQVYGLGEVCLLTLGGTVLNGATLTSDSSGKGVSITPANSGTVNYVGALAMQAGVSGEQILVQVMPGTTLV